ncbi:MAG TPA: LCP family protein [Jatrophihabitantaceae bacterium]
MASHDGDGAVPGGNPPDPSAPLPPELNPRIRRSDGEREASELGAPAGSASPLTARRDVKHGLGIGLRSVTAALAVAILVLSGWAWLTYHNFKSDIRRVNAIGGAGKPGQDVDGRDQNLLVVGNDDRDTATDAELRQLGTTRDGGSYNTDTMMLMHLPANGQKATVISFPRDSYVDIPGHGKAKLNSAYVDGMNDNHGNKTSGARLLVQTIENLTGLTVDHFVQVDLLGFYRISNAIGGVQVNLCQAQHEANSGINLPKGVSTIKGKQALAFVRQRYGLPNGDLDRIKRQQYFLSAAFRKVSSAGTLLNPFKLENLLKAVSNSLQMDNSLDPLKLAEQFQDLSAGNLIFKTIPTHGGEDTDVGSVVVVDPAEVKKFAKQLAGDASDDSGFGNAKTVSPGSFTVDVYNGSTTDGAATRNAQLLRQLGFKVGAVDTAKSHSATTLVEYPKGMQGQARTLAAQVPGAIGQQTGSVSHVTLLLGADGVQVSAAHTTHNAAQRPLNGPAAAPSPSPSNGMSAAQTGVCVN